MPRAKRHKPTHAPGSVAAQVLELLQEHGPQTSTELLDLLGWADAKCLSSALADLRRTEARRTGKPMSKSVYIIRWDTSTLGCGKRLYRRAVYAAGNLPDKPRPPRKSWSEYSRERRDRADQFRQIVATVPNSVFNLGAMQCPTPTTP